MGTSSKATTIQRQHRKASTPRRVWLDSNLARGFYLRMDRNPEMHWPFDPLTWSVLSFLLGVVFGHWLAVYRDKRKEFNEFADSIFLAVNAQVASPAPARRLPGGEIALLRRRMRWNERIRFDAAIENYKKAASEENQRQDSCGQAFYVDDEKVKKAASNLCKFLHRR